MTRYGWLLSALGVMALLAFAVHAAFSDVLLVEWEVAGGVGAALLALGLYVDRATLSRWAAERGARHSAVSGALLLTALGAVVALNVLAQRYDKRVDLTRTGRFTLSEQTTKVVAGLGKDIEVHAFFSAGSLEETKFKDLFAGYAAANPKLKLSLHDPLMEPAAAQLYTVTSSYGTVVLVEAGEGPPAERPQQRLESAFDEEALTNALIRLTAGKEHIICVTTGHEELDADDEHQPTGLGISVLKLEGQNYTVKPVVLLREGRVPADCEVLLVADPQVDWLAPERELLAAFIAGGGDAIVLLDPGHAPGLAADLARYNIAVGDDFVLEQNPNYQLDGGDLSYVILDRASLDMHPATDPLKGGLVLRVARTVGVLDPEQQGLAVQVLARTTMHSFAERDYADPAKMGFTEGRDVAGPVPLVAVVEVRDPEAIPVGSTRLDGAASPRAPQLPAAAPVEGAAAAPVEGAAAAPVEGAAAAPVEGAAAPPAAPAALVRKAGGKLVVIGDSDFATNEMVDNFSNKDLLPNLLAWMVGEEDQISIRPETSGAGSFTLTAIQTLLLGLLALLVAPGLALLGALQTWRARRSR
ncbi:MAG: hypothetical protein RL071_1408 [Pseudomonadota bacterium]|jgi:hypothetical protein